MSASPPGCSMDTFRNQSAHIEDISFSKDMTYQGQTVLEITGTYPRVRLPGNSGAAQRINTRYHAQAQQFFRNASGALYRDAVEDYRQAQANGYPFHPYTASLTYETAMNERCHLSTYFLNYQYTGGAHGTTQRTSDSFDLRTGRRITLPGLFAGVPDWRKKLLAQVICMADENMKENPGIYFDNYQSLIVRTFNPDSFNLTCDALVIYYQQYDIAPYVTGIVTFDIPYASVGLKPPSCGR